MLNSEWSAVFVQLGFFVVLLRIIAQLTPRPRKLKTLIVMGSGGHTSELLRFLQTMDRIDKRLSPRHYVIATTDVGEKGSQNKVIQFEQKIKPENVQQHQKQQQPKTSSPSSTITTPNYFIHRIPRSREVGQSYFTSIFTTLYSLISSFIVVWRVKPDLVFANGPGTCLPICFCAWLLKVVGITPHCYIVLSESYACVYHSSLTTKLLYPFVNVLFVQWTNLLKKYPKALYSGRIPLKPERVIEEQQQEPSPSPSSSKTYVLVTVGTTLFENLIRTIDTQSFASLLKSLGYKGIHIQYGSGRPPVNITKAQTPNFECKCFDYKEDLTEEIRGCSLIIGHAGVGTIFEALEMEKNIIVVPNSKLMNNHQAEISKEMALRGYLMSSTCESLLSDVARADFKRMIQFPKKESQTWATTLILKLKL